jgi:rubrerythrin
MAKFIKDGKRYFAVPTKEDENVRVEWQCKKCGFIFIGKSWIVDNNQKCPSCGSKKIIATQRMKRGR